MTGAAAGSVTISCPCHPCNGNWLTHLSAANRRASGSHYTLGFWSANAPSIIDDDVPELSPERTQAFSPTPSPTPLPIDRDNTPRSRYGIGCSLVSAPADRCSCSACVAIHGAVDPDWPVATFISCSQAAVQADLQAQHHPNHSFPCHKQEESLATWAS